jgi:ABC-type polysaccharide/polyol phosphate transport system ATPase subunit
LLKLLTGITSPTTGFVRVHGRMASLLELGAGFHPEFSGKDNIYLNCSLLGMRDDEIDERYESIVAFSELGDFIDRPVKTYSSGMYVRLGFSVASSVNPDILLIDEALSVGDEHFKGKCVNRLNEFSEKGRTIIFVSHDLGTIRSMCRSVILMDQGEIVVQGPAETVADEYLKRVHERGNERHMELHERGSQYPRWGSGEIRTEAIELFGAGDRPTHVYGPGDPFRVRVAYRVLEAASDPVFGIGLFRADGTHVNGSNHQWRDEPIRLGARPRGE